MLFGLKRVIFHSGGKALQNVPTHFYSEPHLTLDKNTVVFFNVGSINIDP